MTIKSHLSSEELNLAMIESRLIICRSGYSTVMDLFKLQKNAILIPTPGQTEQEYLAKHHQKIHSIYYQKQERINLKKARFNFIQPKSETKKKLLKVAFDKVGL